MLMAAGVEYLGSQYSGWQYQIGQRTVQGELEAALSRVADHNISTICAGRTDTGVHANGQVVHFHTTADRPLVGWLRGVNSFLPNDIAIQWIQPVADDFHARFSATKRRYHYLLHNRTYRSVIHPQSTWHYTPLALEPMREAAKVLVGQHDFSSFRAAECQANTPVRTIDFLDIYQKGDFFLFDIQANAFLHHMVRNFVGSLSKVGAGDREPAWLVEVLDAKDRRYAGPTARADGLFLAAVNYPMHYDIPRPPTSMIEFMFNDELAIRSS